MIKKILFAFVAALSFTACSGTSEKDGSKPKITIDAGTVTEYTLTFDVTVTDAYAASYVCLAESATTPTEAAILSAGKPIRIGEKVSPTVYNLNPETTYNIIVVAIDDNDVITSSTLTMTTDIESTNVILQASATTYDSFIFTITPKNSEAVYYKMYNEGETATDADIMSTGVSVSNTDVSTITLTPAKGKYFIAAVAKSGSKIVRGNDLAFTIAGADVVDVEVKRVSAKNYGTDILYDIYLKNSDVNVIKLDCYFHTGSTSAFGEYVYSNKAEAGKVAHSYSYSSLLSSTRLYFTGGTVKVEDAGNAQHKITVNMTREDNKVYDFSWTGAIEWQ